MVWGEVMIDLFNRSKNGIRAQKKKSKKKKKKNKKKKKETTRKIKIQSIECVVKKEN